MKNLVIVESPAKARTLEAYLGAGYRVEASIGHVRDLPKSGLGVDVEAGFEPEYVTIEGKGPVLKKLRAAAKEAESILLATDPDREGEAIAYHIAEVLGASKKNAGDRFRRIAFNEITKNAVLAALEHQKRVFGPRDAVTAGTMYNLACFEAAARGNRTTAMEWLERSVGAGYEHAEWMAEDSDPEILHGPDFDALVERARENAGIQP